MGSFREDPTNNKISVKFPRDAKAKFLAGMNQYGLSASEFVLYLLDSYYGDNIETLRNYRHSLAGRLKKGIDRRYVRELQLIQELVNNALKNL